MTAHAAIRTEGGFTLVEVIIAVVILTVGLLGLTTTSGLVTRMIGRGQRSEVAALLAMQQMERARPAACIPAQRVAGDTTIMRGSRPVARIAWTYTDVDGDGRSIRLRVVTDFVVSANRVRTATMETSVVCLI
jgi:prepilin-type N-terminal cleavage/methylation domain-containing protein